MTPTPAKPHRIVRLLDGLWRACSAAQTLILLLSLLAGTLIAAAFLPQQPAGLTEVSAESWLTTTAGAYRNAGEFLRGIGAFHLLGGPWLRFLLAALAFNLTLRLATQAQHLRRAQDRVPPAGLPICRETLPGPLAARLEEAEARLRGPFSTVVCQSADGHAQMIAARGRAGAAGPLLTYGAALLILAGLLLNEALGWRAGDIALAPGGTALLTQAGGLQATLTGIAGSDADDRSSLTLIHHGQMRQVRLGPAQPARWNNLWLAQQAIGQALVATAAGSDNRPLLLQSLAPGGGVEQTLRVLFGQAQGEQEFAIPTRNLAFRVVSYPALPERGIQRPVFLVEAYRGNETAPAISELVEDKATFTLDNVTLALQRDRYISLQAAYLPGLLLILLGILAALAGVALTAFFGPVRAWIGLAADQGNVHVAARVAAPADGHSEAERLLALLRPAAPEEPADAG